MVAMPNEPNFDLLARNHILSIKQGVLIEGDDRPDTFGKWDTTVSQIERLFRKCKGNPEKISDIIDDMARADPALQKLLADPKSSRAKEIMIEESKDEVPPLNFSLPPANLDNSLFAKVRTQFLDFAKELSPESYDWFLEGAFWWTCSSIAMRRIAINFSEPMYTNLYIALCAKSSVWKKSTGLRPARRILKELDLLHISHEGSETPEAFIQQAAGFIPRNWDELREQEQIRICKELATAGLGGLFIDELGQYLLGTRNATGPMGLWRRIILEWHDCREKWPKKTKGGGWEIVEKTYLPIFGCIVPDNMNEKEMEALKKDGTIARFLAIASPSGTGAEVHSFELGYLPTPPELVEVFSSWHQRLKPPKVTIIAEEKEIADKRAKDGVRTVVEWVPEWVQPLEETLISLTPEAHKIWHNYRVAIRKCMIENDLSSAFSAYYDRLGTDLIKMAALAASFEGKRLIDLTHIAMAFPFIEEARQGIHRLLAQAGIDKSSEDNHEEKMALAEKEVLHEIREYFNSSDKEYFTIPVLLNRRPKLQKMAISRVTERINDIVGAGILLKEIDIHPVNKKKTVKFSLNTD